VTGLDMSKYEDEMKKSWVWKELHEVRNIRPSFNSPLGFWGGVAYSGVDSLLLKGHTPWTLRIRTGDSSHTERARYGRICLVYQYLINDGNIPLVSSTPSHIPRPNHLSPRTFSLL